MRLGDIKVHGLCFDLKIEQFDWKYMQEEKESSWSIHFVQKLSQSQFLTCWDAHQISSTDENKLHSMIAVGSLNGIIYM